MQTLYAIIFLSISFLAIGFEFDYFEQAEKQYIMNNPLEYTTDSIALDYYVQIEYSSDTVTLDEAKRMSNHTPSQKTTDLMDEHYYKVSNNKPLNRGYSTTPVTYYKASKDIPKDEVIRRATELGYKLVQK